MNLDIGSESNLSILTDPFAREKVTSIHMHGYPNGSRSRWSATVEFKNGNTEGTQKLRGETLPELITAMKVFLESLTPKTN